MYVWYLVFTICYVPIYCIRYKGILLRIDDGIEKRKAVEGRRRRACLSSAAGWRLLGANRADCWEMRREKTMGRSVRHASTVSEEATRIGGRARVKHGPARWLSAVACWDVNKQVAAEHQPIFGVIEWLAGWAVWWQPAWFPEGQPTKQPTKWPPCRERLISAGQTSHNDP